MVKTPAIVLSSLKYGDSAKIIKLYTETSGLKSFISNSVYTKHNRKNAVFISLNQIEIIFEEKNHQNLLYFKEASHAFHYQSLYQNPTKTTIALFLTEILNSVLNEEESNPGLFQFIKNSLIEFDKKQAAFADFHLWFLINLTRYLGFYPNLENDAHYFDLTNGISTQEIPAGFYITGADLENFENLISLDFLNQTQTVFNQSQRNLLLSTLVRYYELHLADFRKPKSLDVLNSVFE